MVILCTDGLANVGLGSLDDSSEENMLKSQQYYEKVTEYALEKGVIVHIITMRGEACNIS